MHIVREKENLYQISKMYGTTVERIAKLNGIKYTDNIYTGQRLIIPGMVDSNLIWPVRGNISSHYGKRESGRFHSGIDITAPEGTPIRAVADGWVLASAKRLNGYSGYGTVVILVHGDGITTLYAHNKRNHAKSGSCIKAGEVIAEVGESGNATGSHVHFEIRKTGYPVDPLSYLP
jgi:murein DD-endopeptidase MepM/ murein hydrolase activator NlpD